jgi:hypothetical protein
MENNQWEAYDLGTLKSLYEKEKADLTDSLLKGVSWESLRDQRRSVTELAIVIHKKMTNTGNPAEVNTRKKKG